MKFFVFPLAAIVSVMSIVSCSQTGVVATTNNDSSSPQTSGSTYTNTSANNNTQFNKTAAKQQALQNTQPQRNEVSNR